METTFSKELKNDFFSLTNAARPARTARIRVFEEGQFHFNNKLYRHLLEAFHLMTKNNIEIENDLLILFSQLALQASQEARKDLGEVGAGEMMINLHKSQIDQIIKMLKAKIEQCDAHRDEQTFSAETMIDLKTAVLELRLLTLAEIID